MNYIKIITYISKFLLLSVMLGATSVALSYEVETHAEISESAVFKSVLKTGTLLSDIGLESNPGDDPSTVNILGYTVLGLIRHGAISEDNLLTLRPVNHFYNPLNGEGLSVLGTSKGEPAPDWALEDNKEYLDQRSSYKDTREQFLKGLTESRERDRQTKLIETFISLGRVIHLVQDAAQPQHTRNESHVTESFYEEFANNHRGELRYLGYPVVKLNTARDYWHTLPPQPNKTSGLGLAEYSNRGFFSSDTNLSIDQQGNVIHHDDFPNPDPLGMSSYETTIKQIDPLSIVDGNVTFYENNVVDNNLPSMTKLNSFATTLSIFDQYLQANGSGRQFALNYLNHRSAQEFLIPRSVGYSAGMIDYFFRGKIDIESDPDSTGYIIKNLGEEPMSGEFRLYYDAANGDRIPVTDGRWLTSDYTATGVLDADGEMIVPTFTPPTDPEPKNTGEYILVFNGDLGEEKKTDDFVGAVIGQIVSLKELIYLGAFSIGPAGRSAVQVYTNTGELVTEYSPGRFSFTFHLPVAVFKGSRYTTGFFGESVINKDGNFFGNLPGQGDLFITTNSFGIYVTTNNHCGNVPFPTCDFTKITHIDHNGNLISVWDLNEFGAHHIAANDSGLIAGWFETARIHNLDGSVAHEFSGEFNFILNVAATKDRFFVLDGLSNSAVLHVYNLQGQKTDIVSLSLPNFGTEIVVTEKALYMTSHSGFRVKVTRLFVYDRDVKRNDNGEITSETYTHQNTYEIQQVGADSIAVDFVP